MKGAHKHQERTEQPKRVSFQLFQLQVCSPNDRCLHTAGSPALGRCSFSLWSPEVCSKHSPTHPQHTLSSTKDSAAVQPKMDESAPECSPELKTLVQKASKPAALPQVQASGQMQVFRGDQAQSHKAHKQTNAAIPMPDSAYRLLVLQRQGLWDQTRLIMKDLGTDGTVYGAA